MEKFWKQLSLKARKTLLENYGLEDYSIKEVICLVFPELPTALRMSLYHKWNATIKYHTATGGIKPVSEEDIAKSLAEHKSIAAMDRARREGVNKARAAARKTVKKASNKEEATIAAKQKLDEYMKNSKTPAAPKPPKAKKKKPLGRPKGSGPKKPAPTKRQLAKALDERRAKARIAYRRKREEHEALKTFNNAKEKANAPDIKSNEPAPELKIHSKKKVKAVGPMLGRLKQQEIDKSEAKVKEKLILTPKGEAKLKELKVKMEAKAEEVYSKKKITKKSITLTVAPSDSATKITVEVTIETKDGSSASLLEQLKGLFN